MIGADLGALCTPCAVVDLDVVERNCAVMSAMAAERGVHLRPHVKTHKCVAAARLSVAKHAGGITVSTLAEARHFAKAGFEDITYAVPIAPQRMREALEISRTVRRLNLLIDHRDCAAALQQTANHLGIRAHVLVKIDCGYHRAGVDPQRPEAIALVRQVVAAKALCFEGLLTHAGHSYACADRAAIEKVAEQERAIIVDFAQALRAASVAVHTVSIGSTPTMSVAPDLSGVSEIRPGNYVFYDAFQAAIGSCTLADAAFSVLATVIGVFPHDGRLLIDAGALALSKDAGAPGGDATDSYGVVCSLDGHRLPGLALTSLSQEHGLVRGSPEHIAAHTIGGKIRIIANHACLTAACHERYQVVRQAEVVACWTPIRGW